MKRMWPSNCNAILENAEEVVLDTVSEEGGHPVHRNALKARLSTEDYERIWPLAEMRFRVEDGRFAGKAVTLIVNNPHYHAWHPADGGSVEQVAESGRHYTTSYVDVYFLLDEVKEAATVAA